MKNLTQTGIMTNQHVQFSGIAKSHALPSSAEMSDCDKRTIAAGVSSADLMLRAAQAVTEFICREIRLAPGALVVVLCGPGNNGGDGKIVAELLTRRGCNVKQISADSKSYTDTSALSEASLIIDALLGNGQKGPPRGGIAELLQKVRTTTYRVRPVFLALDMPTGMNADTGEVYDPHFSADVSIAIELVKRGMVQEPARSICGKIAAVQIGLDISQEVKFYALTTDSVPRLAPRAGGSHKGSFGRAMIIAGSAQMPGAAKLSALACLRAGAGLVVKTTFEGVREDVPPEFIRCPVKDEGEGIFCPEHLHQIHAEISKAGACVLGPGIGLAPRTRKFFTLCLKELVSQQTPLVIDADALSILAELSEQPLGSQVVLTPHPGEAARLLGTDTAEIQKDRYRAAAEISAKYAAVTVLKGAGTIICSGRGGLVSLVSNPLLATAGSGDVLAGIIGAFLAQGLAAPEAAAAGVFVHARAGEYAARETGGTIIASDIIKQLPSVCTKSGIISTHENSN